MIGLILAITMAALAVLVVAWHVHLAGLKEVSARETLLLSLLALFFSTICTIWVGRWSAFLENKAFIRAALRTAYGLLEELKVAEQCALEGVGRSKGRSIESADVLSAFWEEAVSRVVDHLRGLMRRAEETVANWQELDPEEVQRLAAAQREKDDAIDEIRTAADELTAMLHDLASEPALADTARLRARVEALERERERLEASSALAVPARGEARKLLAMGAFEEAIDAYSAIIARGGGSHTVFLARARARYVAGDTRGALEDLEHAEQINPSDEAIHRLRREIAEGRTLLPRLAPEVPKYREAVFSGNSALAKGDGGAAIRHFDEAGDAGLIPVFAAQNRAMALLILGRYGEARKAVADSLPQAMGPFVRAQALALLCMAKLMEGTSSEDSLEELREWVSTIVSRGDQFHLSQSPIQFLLRGLEAKGVTCPDLDRVLAILSSGVNPGRPRFPSGRIEPPQGGGEVPT